MDTNETAGKIVVGVAVVVVTGEERADKGEAASAA